MICNYLSGCKFVDMRSEWMPDSLTGLLLIKVNKLVTLINGITFKMASNW